MSKQLCLVLLVLAVALTIPRQVEAQSANQASGVFSSLFGSSPSTSAAPIPWFPGRHANTTTIAMHLDSNRSSTNAAWSWNAPAGSRIAWLADMVTQAFPNLPSSSLAALTTRIIGGTPVAPGRFPYLVSLRDSQDRHFCGGSLIAPRVVLTAAHCLDQTDSTLRNPKVYVGRFFLDKPESGYSTSRCQTSIVHPGWSFTTGLNDIALCILPAAINQTTVTLARTLLQDANVGLTVMGWGSTAEGSGNNQELLATTVYLTGDRACNATFSGQIRAPQQLCAGLPLGGADACQGDSGGPLVVIGNSSRGDLQHGIVSWGRGCGEAGVPGVYTRVSQYINWINAQLKDKLGMQLPAGPTPAPPGPPNPPSPPAIPASDSTNDTSPATPPSPPAPPAACLCNADGRSGGIAVKQVGCAQFSKAAGDLTYYCYVAGGVNCTGAKPSPSYGYPVAYRNCSAEEAAITGSNVLEGGASDTKLVSGPSPPPPAKTPSPAPAKSPTPTPAVLAFGGSSRPLALWQGLFGVLG